MKFLNILTLICIIIFNVICITSLILGDYPVLNAIVFIIFILVNIVVYEHYEKDIL